MKNTDYILEIFKKYYSITILSIVIFIMLGVAIFWETEAEKMDRIQREIDIVKDNNISFANTEVSRLDELINNLQVELNKLSSDKNIYLKCIEKNKSSELPVNCRDITIKLDDELGWKVNDNWLSQEYIKLIGDTPKQRAEFLLDGFDLARGTIDIWIELWEKYKIDPYLAIAIAKADSNLWNQLKSTNNIWNVGNNDRWDVVHYETREDWIEAIFRVLNNKYLGNIYTIWFLSCGGKINLGIDDCFRNWEKVYATSKDNWNNNVINTMRNIYRDKNINEDYNFRK